MGIKLRTRSRVVIGRPRARKYSWSRRDLVWLKWGGLYVSICYHPRRGWEWVSVRRGGLYGELLVLNAARSAT